MPLDRTNGEVLQGLQASAHVVIDYRHLAALTNVQVAYEGTTKKFRTKANLSKSQRPIFEDAMAIAAERFAEKGALLPVVFDPTSVLVQVYPRERKVAVIVQRRIAGEEFYVTRDYELPYAVIRHLLEAAGKQAPALN